MADVLDAVSLANGIATIGVNIHNYDPNVPLSADINNKLAVYAIAGAGTAIYSDISGTKVSRASAATTNMALAKVAMDAAVHNAFNGDTDKVLSNILTDISAVASAGTAALGETDSKILKPIAAALYRISVASGMAANVVDIVSEPIKAFMTDSFEAIGNALGKLAEIHETIVGKVTDGIETAAGWHEEMVGMLTDAIEAVANAASGVENRLDSLPDNIGNNKIEPAIVLEDVPKDSLIGTILSGNGEAVIMLSEDPLSNQKPSGDGKLTKHDVIIIGSDGSIREETLYSPNEDISSGGQVKTETIYVLNLFGSDSPPLAA